MVGVGPDRGADPALEGGARGRGRRGEGRRFLPDTQSGLYGFCLGETPKKRGSTLLQSLIYLPAFPRRCRISALVF